MIMCWFYAKNCILEHMTDKIYPVTGSHLRRPPALTAPPKMDVLAPPLIVPPSVRPSLPSHLFVHHSAVAAMMVGRQKLLNTVQPVQERRAVVIL